MAKGTKKRLLVCKEHSDKILGILNSKKNNADVTEFINTLRFVLTVIDDFVKSKSKERPLVSEDGVTLEKLLKEYEDLLVQIVNTQRFFRFFTSNRVRKKLDQINCQVHREVAQIFIGLQEKKKIKKSGPKKNLKDSGVQDRQTDCIKDEEGRQLWETTFDQVCYRSYLFMMNLEILIYYAFII